MKKITTLMAGSVSYLLSIRTYGILLILILAMALLSPSLVPIAYLIMLYIGTYGLEAYEEKNGAAYYYGMLPVGKRQIVAAKYMLAICEIVLGLLIGAVSYTVHRTPDIGMQLALLAATGCLFTAVMMPFMLLLGGTKARFVVLFLYIGALSLTGIVKQDAAAFAAFAPPAWMLAAAGAALIALSWILSAACYARMECKN